MKVLVFGSSGMLGRYVFSRLYKEHSVVGLSRKELDLFDVKKSQVEAALELYSPDVVINCAGVIKSRNDISDIEFISVNSIFPRVLASVCKEKKIKMYHISTDCVYDGLSRVSYVETDHHNATDVYGKSKSLGENEDCCVVRTSIVGEEVGQTRSLISWAKSKKGQGVIGFTNHFWNGISCLQLAELLSLFIKEDVYWTGVRHVFSPNIVSKCELLNEINDVWKLDLAIVPSKPDDPQIPCYRALSTVVPTWEHYLNKNIPFIKEQLVKMRDYKI